MLFKICTFKNMHIFGVYDYQSEVLVWYPKPEYCLCHWKCKCAATKCTHFLHQIKSC